MVKPLEANPPLIINADAILALAVAYQSFKPISRQCGKVPQRSCGFETVQFQARGALKSRKCLDPLPGGEISGPFVPIADNHYPNKYHELRVTSSVNRSLRRRTRQGAVLDYHVISNAGIVTPGHKVWDQDSIVLLTKYKNMDAFMEGQHTRLPKDKVFRFGGLQSVEDLFEPLNAQVFVEEPDTSSGFKLLTKQ